MLKELQVLVQKCMDDLDKIRIPYRTVRSWKVNSRAKSRWGQCVCREQGIFDISIAAVLLEDSVPDQAALNTIAHELLHTIPGCDGHKGKWKAYAEQINASLPQYQIQRCTSAEDKGIDLPKTELVVRYILQCSGCGAQMKRQKMCPVVKAPYRYRCSSCGGRLKRI